MEKEINFLGTSFTSFPSNFCNSLATGASENSFFTSPFGLPKCEQRITLVIQIS